jgi:hypothetical protein
MAPSGAQTPAHPALHKQGTKHTVTIHFTEFLPFYF